MPGKNPRRSAYRPITPTKPRGYQRLPRDPRGRRLLILLTILVGFALGILVSLWGTQISLDRLFARMPFDAPADTVTVEQDGDELPEDELALLEGVESDLGIVTEPVAISSDPYALHPWAKQSYVPAIMYHDVVAITKQVWFDHTAAELRRDFEAIRDAGATPISIDTLYDHLRNGTDLPEKPILLTFDDAYLGQYENAYPLLQEFNYPATYYVQTGFVGVPTSKDHFTWEQMQEMEASGLVTIAAHTINHPEDLRLLDDETLHRELFESKRILEERLGHPVLHFAYPAGNRDERVIQMVKDAGYIMATTMDNGYVGQSPNLLEVRRFIQFRLTEALIGARAVPQGQLQTYDLNVSTPVELFEDTVDGVHLYTMRGGRAATVHADARYNVGTFIDRYQATAGINGSFFSLPWIYASSNVMVGPVMAPNNDIFVPGRDEDNRAIRGRPLVLFGRDRISFVPFHPDVMNTREDIEQLMPDVTDLFVAGLWLVKDGEALSLEELESFNLSSAAESRPRVFFGIDNENRIIVGVTETHIYSLRLAELLPQLGVREAVLLDSGFSSSLVYNDEVLATGHATAEQPSRPVPHAILLYDLLDLQANPPEIDDPLTRLVKAVPPESQAATEQILTNVLTGDIELEKGDRGPAIYAVQRGLEMVAIGNGDPSPLASGADGVYGNEVTAAIVPYLPPTLNRTTSFEPATSITESAIAAEAIVSQEGTTIDDRTLQSLLSAVADLPSPILVDTNLPRELPSNPQAVTSGR